MYDRQLIADETVTDEDPLGPVATMPTVTFGAREAALAGVEHGSAGAFTWHITCTSATVGHNGPDQGGS